MLERCYSQSLHKRRPSLIGCEVHEDWKSLKNFRAWMESKNYKNRTLSKEMFFEDNKLYSPDTCLFVPNGVSLLFANTTTKGKMGVYYNKLMKQYQATIRQYNVNMNLGYSKTMEEAVAVYSRAKAKHILEVANALSEEEDARLKPALIRRSEEYLKRADEYKLARSNQATADSTFAQNMRTKRSFHSSGAVYRRLKLSPSLKVDGGDTLSINNDATTTRGKESGMSRTRTRILFDVDDLTAFVEKILKLQVFVKVEKDMDIRGLARALATEGEGGMQKFIKLRENKEGYKSIGGEVVKNCNFSVYTGEKAASVSGDIGIGIGTEDDTVLLQRSTVESLLHYASDFDIGFPRGV